MKFLIGSCCFLLVIGCKNIRPNSYVLRSYTSHSIKKGYEILKTDSTLILFTNADMSGCLLNIFKQRAKANDTITYTIDSSNWAVLSQTYARKCDQDSITFFFRPFSKYCSLDMQLIKINGTQYEMDDNCLRISKSDIVKNSKDSIINLTMIYLGGYSLMLKIFPKESSINIFFHFNSSSSLNRNFYRFASIKTFPAKNEKTILVLGNDSLLMSRFPEEQSAFSELLKY